MKAEREKFVLHLFYMMDHFLTLLQRLISPLSVTLPFLENSIFLLYTTFMKSNYVKL